MDMKQFDQSYAEQLFELREMLEHIHFSTFSIYPMMTLAGCKKNHARTPPDAARQHWQQLSEFSQLDRDFHAMLLSAADNIFLINHLKLSPLSFIFTINGMKRSQTAQYHCC